MYIDDKIISRANEQSTSSEELANRFIQEFHTDMDNLGIDRPDIEPKATEHIHEMVTMIGELIDKGKAYEAGGDVYYIVDSFPEYGKLSKRNIDDMRAGARISVCHLWESGCQHVIWACVVGYVCGVNTVVRGCGGSVLRSEELRGPVLPVY